MVPSVLCSVIVVFLGGWGFLFVCSCLLFCLVCCVFWVCVCVRFVFFLSEFGLYDPEYLFKGSYRNGCQNRSFTGTFIFLLVLLLSEIQFSINKNIKLNLVVKFKRFVLIFLLSP